MVLKACLAEAGYFNEIRHTVDIDANWYVNAPITGERMIDSLQKALVSSGIDLDISIYRTYGNGRSAGFKLADKVTNDVLFSMDIDVNRPATPTKIYEIAGFKFRGVAPAQMLADKTSVISTDKVFRRIKDMVDLYYLSKVVDFNKGEIMQILKSSGRGSEQFYGFLHRKEELKHAYEKFRFSGDIEKPSFDEVYNTVKVYIKAVLPKERHFDPER